MLSVAPRAPLPESPEELVRSAPELEALPIVAQRLVAIHGDERTTVDQIANLLSTDQALVAAVLRYANSAGAMPNRRIGNVREAIARMSQRALNEVLVRACAGPMLDRGLPPYALPRRTAWRHAATSSVAARELAQLRKIGGADEASVAGLLHDVGKIVLTSVLPEAVAEAVSIARSRRLEVWQAEEEVIGFDHGAVGAALLRSWDLPESVAQAVELHHRASESTNPLVTVVYLADAAANAVGAVGGGGACPQPEWNSTKAAEALGSTIDEVEKFLEGLRCVEESDL
jgi:putative nucleotidyltransferase with HDIG domain